MWVFLFLVSVATMLIAEQMARARNRSIRAWVWITAIVGPFGPLALYILGHHSNETSQA
jgi:hypothetical protein